MCKLRSCALSKRKKNPFHAEKQDLMNYNRKSEPNNSNRKVKEKDNKILVIEK